MTQLNSDTGGRYDLGKQGVDDTDPRSRLDPGPRFVRRCWVPSGGSGRGHWPAFDRPSASWVTTSRIDFPNAVGAISTPNVRQMTTVIFSSNRLRA